MTQRKASSAVTINAPIDRVWKVATDIGHYAKWNPFVIDVTPATAVPAVDLLMKFEVQFQNRASTVSTYEKVTVFQPPHLSADPNGRQTAVWAYEYVSFISRIGMIRATRTHHFTETADGQTDYFTEEIFTGWGASFVPLADVQVGFDQQTEAMRRTAEM